jgi:hypothetical protein
MDELPLEIPDLAFLGCPYIPEGADRICGSRIQHIILDIQLDVQGEVLCVILDCERGHVMTGPAFNLWPARIMARAAVMSLSHWDAQRFRQLCDTYRFHAAIRSMATAEDRAELAACMDQLEQFAKSQPIVPVRIWMAALIE